MKHLSAIPSFPAAARRTLEKEYGIESEEAFYGHAVADAAAPSISEAQMGRLMRLVEGYLSADYIRRWHWALVKRPRGVIEG